jgi:hypothetical protein
VVDRNTENKANIMSTANINDLTQHPPRSPRLRLGGYVILPRILDKARAKAEGKNGEYDYPGHLDKRFFDFVKIEPEALFVEVKAGKGDGEILDWIQKNAGYKPTPWEIAQWSAYNDARAADTLQAKERSLKALTKLASHRTDILTGFDLLDLDDFVSFGGKA